MFDFVLAAPSVGFAFLCYDSAIQASLIALAAPSVRLFSRFAEQVLGGQRLAGLHTEGLQGDTLCTRRATHRCRCSVHLVVGVNDTLKRTFHWKSCIFCPLFLVKMPNCMAMQGQRW